MATLKVWDDVNDVWVTTAQAGPTGPAGVDHTAMPKLHSTDDYVKFAIYWPIKSPFPNWWKELDNGVVSWVDVAADLDQLKDDVGCNAVRVFTYYNHQYLANNANLGWTDGLGNHNPVYLANLSTFIDMCAARGLDVIVTMYQLLPALKYDELEPLSPDWDFLENDIAHFESFHSWMLTLLGAKPNVHLYNLINEPDGYGTWGNVPLAGRILTFLSRLKAVGKAVAPHLKCMVNTTTHDNNFRRFPGGPPGENTVYELSDILALNTFLWADNGNIPNTSYRTQVDYINLKNVLRKPVVMTECGHPSHYGQQDVAGYPILNEDGTEAGTGNAPTTVEGLIPEGGGIFDRPKGNGIPHTPENQARGVAEAAYWAGLSSWAGLGVWAGFDHKNTAVGFVYRDPFGVVDEDGTPLPAAGVFKAALAGVYDNAGEFRISLAQGTVLALPSRINGLNPWNGTDVTQNTIGGVYLAPSGGTWTSDALIVGVPLKIRIDFTLRVTNTHAEPIVIRLTGASKAIDFRYKVYAVNAWQRIDSTSADVDAGFAQTTPLAAGDHSIIIDLTAGLAPRVTHNGTLLAFDDSQPGGDLAFIAWQAVGLKLRIANNGNSAIDINRLTALGAAGEPIAFEARTAVGLPAGPAGATGSAGSTGAPGPTGTMGPLGAGFLVGGVSGTVAAGVSTARVYNDTGRSVNVIGVRATVGTAPTGAALIVDVNKNGTSIFTTQANRPTIAISGFTSGKVTNMDVVALADGDYLTCDVDQVGSTIAGSNLTVQVEVS